MITRIYSFVDKDGVNTHINAEGLRQWCIETKQEIWNIPLREKVAKMMMENNIVAPERIVELSKRKSLDPIIMCKDGTFDDNGAPNVMIVDGHHRFVLACLAKLKSIPGHVLELEQWKPFQIHGLPDLTQEELIKAPITKRNY
jgi:hypothetical protein